MSASQSLLAVGAILLLMNITTSLNRSYVAAIGETMSHQVDIEAIQFGQALSENLFSASRDYDNLDTLFGGFDDVTTPGKRFQFVTAFGDSLFATVQLGSEKTLRYSITGRVANIEVFSKEDDQYIKRVENSVTLNRR